MSTGYPYTWNANEEYEALSVVVYAGTHYKAKKHVPMGIDINNTAFWKPQTEATQSSIIAADPLYGNGTAEAPLEVKSASDTSAGVVKPDNSTIIAQNGVISVKTNTFLTRVYASAPLKGWGTSANQIAINKATVNSVGVVKPDGTTITITDDGTISADISSLEQRITALENAISKN